MPSKETLRKEAEMAAAFERADARQQELGYRLDSKKGRSTYLESSQKEEKKTKTFQAPRVRKRKR